MHTLVNVLRLAAVGAALLGWTAHAQLLLTGNVTGEFTDVPGINDTIVNAADGSAASFKSGIPEHGWDKRTAIDFSQKDFTDIGPGLVASNLFLITNGRTLLHSTATDAHFDLWLNLTAPGASSRLLTQLVVTIENTPNGADPNSVDDVYTVSSTPIAPFKLDDQFVHFSFVAPPSFTIHENESRPVGDLYVSFTSAPEPSTFAAIGGVLLVGVAAWRALRRRPVCGAAVRAA